MRLYVLLVSLVFLLGLGSVSATDADSNGLIDEHEAITEYYGGFTCGAVSCHPTEAADMLASTHYLWSGPAGIGKANTMNTFCTSPVGSPQGAGLINAPGLDETWGTADDVANVEVGGGCLMCHVGLGLVSLSNLGTGQWNNPAMAGIPETMNIDCLICHAADGYNRLSYFAGQDNMGVSTESDPSATYGLPGSDAYFFMGMGGCMVRANLMDADPANDCTDYNGQPFRACTASDVQPCFYNIDGMITMDDKMIMMDEKLVVTLPVAPGFVDDYFMSSPTGALGTNIPGCGPRVTNADMGANPSIVPQMGSMGPMPMNNGVAIAAAQNVKMLADEDIPSKACGRCHAGSGGGKNSKRGEMEMAIVFGSPTADQDVHLAAGLDCADCHIPVSHSFPGEGSGTPTGDGHLDCSVCHTATPHSAINPTLDSHVNYIACQTCHITEVAKIESTELNREWLTAADGDIVTLNTPLDALFPSMWGGLVDQRHVGANGIWHEHQDRSTNLVPGAGIDYIWWNGNSNYLGWMDTITVSADEILRTDHQGSLGDGKIYPVKKQTTQWLINQNDNQPIPLTMGAVFQGWGIENALRFGTMRSGRDMDGSLAAPFMFWDLVYGMCAGDMMCTYNYIMDPANMLVEPLTVGVQRTASITTLNHEVSPVGNALDCIDCHTDAGVMDFQALGYSEPDQSFLTTLYDASDAGATSDVPALPAVGLAVLGGSLAALAIRRMRK